MYGQKDFAYLLTFQGLGAQYSLNQVKVFGSSLLNF